MNILDSLMKRTRKVFQETKYLRPLAPVIETVDAALFGHPESVEESPYLRDHIDLKRIMLFVILAAMPAALASVYFYGWKALTIIIVSYAAGGIAEVVFDLIRGEEISEGFLVTGILFPLILPPTIPLWMVALGVIVGVIFGKEVFGGTGYNIFNPALVGRVFLTITFPVQMSSNWIEPAAKAWGGFTHYFVNTVSAASPLTTFESTGELVSLQKMLLGTVPGCLGETSKILLILGGILLVITKIIDWRIPLAYLGSVALFSLLGTYVWPNTVAPPLFQLLAGGLLFGAVFMATDPVTCPTTIRGRWIYGVGVGILTVAIRSFSGYPEGVMFSILMLNLFSPLIDELVITYKFGQVEKPYETG